jgi:CMP-N-acetylneuraminic acid synthetase
MKVCAMIPLKKNSERVPNKNSRLLGGNPLYTYAFSALWYSKTIDTIYVNSSDDEYLAEAFTWGFVPIKRPEELNSPESHSNDLIRHTLDNIEGNFDIFITHYAPTPFITSETIDTCVTRLKNDDSIDCVLGATEVYNRIWFENKEVNHNSHILIGTQSMNPVLAEVPFCVFRVEAFQREGTRTPQKVAFHIMSPEEAFDIDTELDFKIAEFLYGEFSTKPSSSSRETSAIK